MRRHIYKLFTTDGEEQDKNFAYIFTDGVLDTYEWLAIVKRSHSGKLYFEIESTIFKIRELKKFCKEYNSKFNTHRKVKYVKF